MKITRHPKLQPRATPKHPPGQVEVWHAVITHRAVTLSVEGQWTVCAESQWTPETVLLHWFIQAFFRATLMDLLWICANSRACLPSNGYRRETIFKINDLLSKTCHMSLLTICLLKRMWHHDSFHWSIFSVPNSEGKPENWNRFFPTAIKLGSDVPLDSSFCIECLSAGMYSWQTCVCVVLCVGCLTGGPLAPGSPVFPLRPWETNKAKENKSEGGWNNRCICAYILSVIKTSISCLPL